MGIFRIPSRAPDGLGREDLHLALSPSSWGQGLFQLSHQAGGIQPLTSRSGPPAEQYPGPEQGAGQVDAVAECAPVPDDLGLAAGTAGY